MSLLTLIQGAAVRCGLAQPTAVIGSSDPNVPLLQALAQDVGDELARRHDWQVLKIDYTVPTLAAETQTALPADYDRMLPNGEMWNRSIALRYDGPTDDFDWGRIKALNAPAATGWWRLIGGALQITPAPTAGQTLAFPYMSKNWIAPAVGSNKAAWTIDTDTARIPEQLLKLGIIWAWKSGKGFDYAEFLATHERELERYTSRDRGIGPIIIGKSRPNESGLMNTWPGRIIV
jgi:hypothetical protein